MPSAEELGGLAFSLWCPTVFLTRGLLPAAAQVLFNFIGQMLVLQPHEDMTFVAGEPGHPLLPPGPGLFLLRHPAPQDAPTAAAAAANAEAAGGAACSSQQTGVAGSPPASGTEDARQAEPRRMATSVREAQWELMNSPHPLDMLSDPAAYGAQGQVSRYHNPDNYTRAVGCVLRQGGAGALGGGPAGGVRPYAPPLLVRPSAGRHAGGEAGPSSTAAGSTLHLEARHTSA